MRYKVFKAPSLCCLCKGSEGGIQNQVHSHPSKGVGCRRQTLRLRRKRQQTRLAASSDEPDIAVFRFTLGIPGFDDADIPKILGYAALALLALNNILNDGPSDSSQVRAESIGVILAGLAIAVPSVNRRLEDALPGRGRRASSATQQGARQAFHLKAGLQEEAKQELAWASFALLKNITVDGLLVCSGPNVLMARGEVRQEAELDAPLQQADEIDSMLQAESSQAYYTENPPAKGFLKRLIPPGVQTLFVEKMGGKREPRYLVMWSKTPRSMSLRDRQWAVAVGSKLSRFV